MSVIKTKVQLDNTDFNQKLEQAKSKVEKFSTQSSGSSGGLFGDFFKKMIPTFDLSGMFQSALGFLKSMAFYGADLADNIERAGISAQSFQKLETMTMRGGGNQEEMVKALGKLEVAQSEVIKGNEDTIKTFERLGLTEKDVASMNIDELYIRVAQAFQTSGRSATAYSDVLNLLGKTAKNLIPSFEEVAEMGSTHFETMSDRGIIALDSLTNKGEELWTNFKRKFSSGVGIVAEWIMGKDTIDAAMQNTEQTQALQRQANLQDLANRQKKEAEDKAKKEADKAAKETEKAAERIAEIRERAREREQEMKDRFQDRVDSIRVNAPQADTLARMGAAIGAQSDPAIAAAQRQIELQKIQNDLAKEHLKYAREIAQKIDKVGGLKP